MIESNEENSETGFFYRFITAAESDIGLYEAAKHRANLDEVARVLHELRRHVTEARNEWMGIELYFPEPTHVWPWYAVPLSQNLPIAVRTICKIIKNELAHGSLQGAGAALLKLQEHVNKELGIDEPDE